MRSATGMLLRVDPVLRAKHLKFQGAVSHIFDTLMSSSQLQSPSSLGLSRASVVTLSKKDVILSNRSV